MRNTGLIIILIFLAFACTNNKSVEDKAPHVADKIFQKIIKSYGDVSLYDTLGDGSILYRKTIRGKGMMAAEKSIIGIVDKTLNKVADESKKSQIGSGYTYNSYEYNTPEIELTIQSSFFYEDTRQNDSVYIRFWVFKK